MLEDKDLTLFTSTVSKSRITYYVLNKCLINGKEPNQKTNKQKAYVNLLSQIIFTEAPLEPQTECMLLMNSLTINKWVLHNGY